ncbi:rhodanese-like domain-containing protein [soil metagenome]
MMKSTIATIIVIAIAGLLMFNFFSKTPGNDMDLNVSEFKEKLESQPGLVIDVRTDEEYNNGNLALTDYQYNFLDGEFEKQLDQMDKDKTYYLYCRTGNRSGKAAKLMKERGFNNVYNVGGFEDLANGGFATKDNLDE